MVNNQDIMEKLEEIESHQLKQNNLIIEQSKETSMILETLEAIFSHSNEKSEDPILKRLEELLICLKCKEQTRQKEMQS